MRREPHRGEVGEDATVLHAQRDSTGREVHRLASSTARFTSDARYLRWPPNVLNDVSFPARAHRVTVFGLTRNIRPTSAGVSRGSPSFSMPQLYPGA